MKKVYFLILVCLSCQVSAKDVVIAEAHYMALLKSIEDSSLAYTGVLSSYDGPPDIALINSLSSNVLLYLSSYSRHRQKKDIKSGYVCALKKEVRNVEVKYMRYKSSYSDEERSIASISFESINNFISSLEIVCDESSEKEHWRDRLDEYKAERKNKVN